MAGGMQLKIMTRLSEIVCGPLDAYKKAQLDFVDQAKYANVGTVYVQRDFVTVFEIGYDFQDTGCSFSISGDAMRRYFQRHPEILNAVNGKRFAIKRSTGGDIDVTKRAYGDSQELAQLFDLIRALVNIALNESILGTKATV